MQLKILEEISIGPERDQKLACVDKFCYLGDMIGTGGGAEEASRVRVRCAWVKFCELVPSLNIQRGVHENERESI